MSLWSRVSPFIWQEAEAPPAPATMQTAEGAAGVPAYLRKAVRFAVTGFAATLLTAQLVGISLVVPAAAQCYPGSPSPGGFTSCNALYQYCRGQRAQCVGTANPRTGCYGLTNTGANACKAGTACNDCIRQCQGRIAGPGSGEGQRFDTCITSECPDCKIPDH